MLFWMNALAFRVYNTFRKMSMPLKSDDVRKRLFYYCLYAQGVPFLVCGITGLADQFVSRPDLRPNMGEYRCFLSCHSGIQCTHTDNRFIMPMFIYFRSVQMFINITNFILFILTTYHLVQQWKESSRIQRLSLLINLMSLIWINFFRSKSNKKRMNFFILLKISLLVGN
jgi:hypothetical protein